MTEDGVIAMLSETLGAVVVPDPLLDNADPQVIAWKTWNRSRPATDWSKVPTIAKQKRRERKAARRGWAA